MERMDRDLLRHAREIRALLATTVALGLVGAAATIAQMALFGHATNLVFLRHLGIESATPTLALMLVAIAVRAVATWLREWLAGRVAADTKSRLRERLIGHLARLGPAYVRGERTGELVAVGTEGVERLEPYLARFLPQMALSVLVPVAILIYVFPRDWASGIVLLVTAPIIPILMVLVGSYSEKRINRQWLALTRLSAQLLDSIQGLPTLRLFGAGAAERERVRSASEGFRRRTMDVLKVAFLSGLVLEFMIMMAIALLAVTLGVRLLSGGIPFERAFVILLLAPEFYRPLRELGVQHHAGMEGRAAAKHITEILNTPVVAASAGRKIPIGRPVAVSFEGVSFRYPGSETPALRDVSLELPADSVTALVGPSGAGKTTLANLMLRFCEPTSGRIAANGVPVRSLAPDEWRGLVALVPQRPHLFHGTIADNLRLGRPDASDEEVARAARLAGAEAFILDLPRGYDTQVGERGSRLSQGQAQRIAIARAFLKDAPVLVLDEPASSLDPESEGAIREAVSLLSRGRTVLVIAHRLNTIRSADRVVVLDRGRVVESGPPAGLEAAHGTYEALMLRRGASA